MKLVKYYATWCGPCKRFAPVAERVAKEMGIPLEEVDIDQSPTEGIQTVPATRLYADDGTILAEKSGVMTPVAMRQWVAENTPS